MNDFTPPIKWRRSSRSGSVNNCVEVGFAAQAVGVRDSKNVTGPVLVFDEGAWRTFLGGARTGTFDLV